MMGPEQFNDTNAKSIKIQKSESNINLIILPEVSLYPSTR
ncbi:hypothetical protein HNQ40_003082 [Algisphaera agarilytica]|uniref:Uncharacterized protein n=1 Tax=Algisphaera agarilytica TaxID=1385975 RepID=A0A7X0H8N7_9BACT|nr:hypothetical protein [Algisphaera agarilytica]